MHQSKERNLMDATIRSIAEDGSVVLAGGDGQLYGCTTNELRYEGAMEGDKVTLGDDGNGIGAFFKSRPVPQLSQPQHSQKTAQYSPENREESPLVTTEPSHPQQYTQESNPYARTQLPQQIQPTAMEREALTGNPFSQDKAEDKGNGKKKGKARDYEDNGQESPNGTLALVLSIIGIFFVPCTIIALIISSRAKKHGYGGDLKIKAAYIISLIFLILWLIGVALIIVSGGIIAGLLGSFARGLGSM